MYIKTRGGTIIDLNAKGVSSYRHVSLEEAVKEYGLKESFYEIYYYDVERGCHLETDEKGGRSMDCFDESEIIESSERLEDLFGLFIIIDETGKISISISLEVAIESTIKTYTSTGKCSKIFGAIATLGSDREPIIASKAVFYVDGTSELLIDKE